MKSLWWKNKIIRLLLRGKRISHNLIRGVVLTSCYTASSALKENRESWIRISCSNDCNLLITGSFLSPPPFTLGWYNSSQQPAVCESDLATRLGNSNVSESGRFFRAGWRLRHRMQGEIRQPFRDGGKPAITRRDGAHSWTANMEDATTATATDFNIG